MQKAQRVTLDHPPKKKYQKNLCKKKLNYSVNLKSQKPRRKKKSQWRNHHLECQGEVNHQVMKVMELLQESGPHHRGKFHLNHVYRVHGVVHQVQEDVQEVHVVARQLDVRHLEKDFHHQKVSVLGPRHLAVADDRLQWQNQWSYILGILLEMLIKITYLRSLVFMDGFVR